MVAARGRIGGAMGRIAIVAYEPKSGEQDEGVRA